MPPVNSSHLDSTARILKFHADNRRRPALLHKVD